MSDLSSSTVRITHFRVERELGRDGLGYVFHAVDEQLERPVALRVARAGTCFSGPDIAAARTRFRDDARRAAAISHPNLVTIFEFRALTETDLMVMELVNGETLAELQERGTRWTVLETARILARLSDALAVAHEAGLVHGRVRIHNVRIRPDGRVKLLDLGVPREPVDELSGEPVFRDDVRGLARLASQMLSPIQPSTSEEAAFAALRDAVTSRARYGFLAPVLLRAIGDTATGAFANAGEFRDALVTALDAATHRATPDGRDDESKWSTRVVGPERNFAEDRLPADGRALFALGRVPPTAGRGRLVLPPDLADQVSAVPEDRLGSSIARHRRPRAPVSAKIAVLIAIVAALTAVAWVAYQRMGPSRNVPQVAIQGNGDNAPEAVAIAPETMPPLYAGPPRDAPPNGAAADSIVTSPAVAETVAVSDSPVGNAPGFQLTAMVRGSPAGTTIGVVDDPTQSWTDAVELSVAPGDTITLQFSRPGYVPQTQRFHGSRLAVELQPDSVVAAFDANTQAQVLLVTGAGERLLGTTPVQVRFPSGSFRITFRAPGQPDWTSVHNMMQPGRRYTVTKTDYVTSGDLIVSVVGTWAMVSLDGGPDRETPIRFDDLSVGAHILRITRDGFQTIVDTVMVQAGAPVTRQYTLQR